MVRSRRDRVNPVRAVGDDRIAPRLVVRPRMANVVPSRPAPVSASLRAGELRFHEAADGVVVRALEDVLARERLEPLEVDVAHAGELQGAIEEPFSLERQLWHLLHTEAGKRRHDDRLRARQTVRFHAVGALFAQADPTPAFDALMDLVVDEESVRVRVRVRIFAGLSEAGFKIPEDRRDAVRKMLPDSFALDQDGTPRQ